MESNEQALSAQDQAQLQTVQAASHEMTVAVALTVARERLGMDVAYVTTVDPEHQTLEAVIGNTTPLGTTTGAAFPIGETYCRRMLDGAMPNVIPDTRAEPAVRELAATENIGAYVGVPVTLSDGSVRGTLCSVSREPRPSLGEAEGRFMRALAAIVARRLEPAT